VPNQGLFPSFELLLINMVWMPDWKWNQLQQNKAKGGGGSWGKGGGAKGKGGGGWGGGWQPKGKGKGKGKGKRSGIKADRTLWVGNIANGTTYQDLKTHCDQAGASKWAEVFKNKGDGTGAVGYGSAEEAQAAIPMLNGSLLNGTAIEVDTWEKQNPK